MSTAATTILDEINAQRRWVLEYAIACPDYKRPSVDRGRDVYSTEYKAYEAAVEKLRDYGLLSESMTASKLGLTGNDAKHWANWQSEEVVRHTLESAKTLVKMTNEGRFSEYHYRDGYMDEPAFKFVIKPEPGTFVLASSGPDEVEVSIHVTHGNDDAIRRLIDEAEDEEVYAYSTFTWTWKSMDDEIEVEGEWAMDKEESSDDEDAMEDSQPK